MKNAWLPLAVLAAALTAPAAARVPAMTDLRVPPAGPRTPPPDTPQPVEIARYETEEEFPFEDDARQALSEREAAFREAGLTTLGGQVVRKPNGRRTFVLEYLPALQPGGDRPAAVTVARYASGGTYWPESAAEAALADAQSRLAQAGLSVVSGAVTGSGRDHSFEISYLMPSSLRRARGERADFQRLQAGRYTFESDAEAAAPDLAQRLRAAGAGVIRARALRRPDRDWSVELEFVVRTNEFGAHPLYTLARYDAQELFPFDSRAAEAAQNRLADFAVDGVLPVGAYARKAGRDYSYSVDYLVRNSYRTGRAEPALKVVTYRAAETFTFESRAQTALEEKAEAFRAAGIPVLEGRVVPVGRDYSYTLDYLAAPARRRPVP